MYQNLRDMKYPRETKSEGCHHHEPQPRYGEVDKWEQVVSNDYEKSRSEYPLIHIAVAKERDEEQAKKVDNANEGNVERLK